mmetsp:Transcript_118219/g.314585  ORF Transcript_118219/g.314585 Transcript_118219/m.314585 type:complete len:135 (-) Transcript_118219:105-509(-)
MIVVGPPPLRPYQVVQRELTLLEEGPPPKQPPAPKVVGDILGDEERAVKVIFEGVYEEELHIDGEKGPMVKQLNGAQQHGSSGLGRYQDGRVGHEGSKAWKEMGRTERELWLIRIAKRQRQYHVWMQGLAEAQR